MANPTSVALSPERTVIGLRRAALGVGVAVGLAGLAFASGGYFPTAWGWAALVALWVVATYLVAGEAARPTTATLVMLGALGALGVWIWLSATWSDDPAQSVLEGQRAILYLGAAAAFAAVVRRESIALVLGSTLAAVVVASAYGLGTRLFPDRIGVSDQVAAYRLEEPLTYWNGLGIFAAMGAVLAFGFAARGRPLVRGLGGASLVILLTTVYFTFSRGAWIAFVIALAVAISLDPRRLQLVVTGLALAAPVAVAVWLSSQQDALTSTGAPLSAATHEGHRLAIWIALLALAAAAASASLELAERRVRVSRTVRLAFAGTLLALALACVLGVFVRYGNPVTLADKAHDAFVSTPPANETDLNKRLLTFNGSYRVDLWQSAWDDYRAHPVLGSGAGTYEQWWNRHRPFEHIVRDAHNLYLETLAELGPLGLILLVLALGAPLLAVRARGHPLVPIALAAYSAYLVHAAVDWDWELPAVTLTALVCAICALAAMEGERKPLSRPFRALGATAALVLAAVALAELVGASALDSSEQALRKGDYAKARTQAHKAARWWRWAPEPWARLGDAEAATGDTAAARAAYRRAIAKDGGDWLLWYDLSSVSDGPAAQSALAEARRLNPFYRADLEEVSGASP